MFQWLNGSSEQTWCCEQTCTACPCPSGAQLPRLPPLWSPMALRTRLRVTSCSGCECWDRMLCGVRCLPYCSDWLPAANNQSDLVTFLFPFLIVFMNARRRYRRVVRRQCAYFQFSFQFFFKAIIHTFLCYIQLQVSVLPPCAFSVGLLQHWHYFESKL